MIGAGEEGGGGAVGETTEGKWAATGHDRPWLCCPRNLGSMLLMLRCHEMFKKRRALHK